MKMVKCDISKKDEVKEQSFHMWSELSCYQLRRDCLIYKMFYESPLVTTKQKNYSGSPKIKEGNWSLPPQKIPASQR